MTIYDFTNLRWKQKGGSYLVNTHSTHACNTDAVVTVAINTWIKKHLHIGHVGISFQWFITYLSQIKCDTFYPGQDDVDGVITQHMLKYFRVIFEYYQWWFSQLACYGHCLTTTGNVDCESELSKRLVGSIVEEAVRERGWYMIYYGSNKKSWREVQGQHHRQTCSLTDYFNLLCPLPEHEVSPIGCSGYLETTVVVNNNHLTKQRQPQKNIQVPKPSNIRSQRRRK